MKYATNNRRLWLFGILVAIAAGLMIAAFALPWWTGDVTSIFEDEPVNIYGWGLPEPGIELYQLHLATDITPAWQTQLAWAYVGVSVIAALVSTVLKGVKGQMLLGLVGIGLLAYALIAVFFVISGRLGELGEAGLVLQGTSVYANEYGVVTVDASLRFWFYLACITGILFNILSFLKPRITGSN